MKKFLIFLFILLIFPIALSYSNPKPVEINLKQDFTIPPEIKKFKYWYGDIDYGIIIYLGSVDISGFETELHLSFNNKSLSSILLILGPAGLDSFNCIKKYKKVVSLLNEKYGNFYFKSETKDPLIEDLISETVCDPIRLGLYSVKTFWNVQKAKIISSLIGDQDGFYIEIEYIYSDKNEQEAEDLFKLL